MDTSKTKPNPNCDTTPDAEGNVPPCAEIPDPKCKNKKSDVAKYPTDCSRLYSKAICLEMSTTSCYFDLN